MTTRATSRTALTLAVLALLASCGTTATPPGGPTTMEPTSSAAPGNDARAAQHRTLAILEQVYDQLQAPDTPPLAEQAAPGAEAVCTLDESDPAMAWTEMVFLTVDSPATQARLAREWLAAEGYEQTQSRQGGTITSHLFDGYTVTVAEWPDGRVELNVESPCLAAPADGR
ncbi:hypothetical protein [Ornithinimicrobium pratense]|uniref:Uncharacterized protein n=1 Tax=Ornithinimicrobium pratense TaxID=2593973 RepID=A0A5J6V3A4_9MICO|nr:hypothetical protein [Ornithinimicrobium pratense]QFG67423.1 hypothetical protein FY030_00620 [Ornithinimicrobium pratense]